MTIFSISFLIVCRLVIQILAFRGSQFSNAHHFRFFDAIARVLRDLDFLNFFIILTLQLQSTCLRILRVASSFSISIFHQTHWQSMHFRLNFNIFQKSRCSPISAQPCIIQYHNRIWMDLLIPTRHINFFWKFLLISLINTFLTSKPLIFSQFIDVLNSGDRVIFSFFMFVDWKIIEAICP